MGAEKVKIVFPQHAKPVPILKTALGGLKSPFKYLTFSIFS